MHQHYAVAVQSLPCKIGDVVGYDTTLVGFRQMSTAFCHIKDVCCEMNLQQLWRQVFCSCRSEAVEQPSSWTATNCHDYIISFQPFKRLL